MEIEEIQYLSQVRPPHRSSLWQFLSGYAFLKLVKVAAPRGRVDLNASASGYGNSGIAIAAVIGESSHG